MTPEEKQQFERLKRTVEEQSRFIKSLTSNSTIPLEVHNAFNARFALSFKTASKTAASETQAVDEGGSGTYNVSTPPDGFFEVPGQPGKYIPYHT